jgi:hypothetical protein
MRPSGMRLGPTSVQELDLASTHLKDYYRDGPFPFTTVRWVLLQVSGLVLYVLNRVSATMSSGS